MISDIPDYPGYDIHSDGRVYSHKTDKFLSLSRTTVGYVKVRLYNESGGKTFLVHRLVAKAFLGDHSDTLDVCHIDSNQLNNDVSNLRWGTKKSNTADILAAGNHVNQRKTHCPSGHELSGNNLFTSDIRRGSRGCASCALARRRLKIDKWSGYSLQELSDMIYKKRMSG